MIKQIGLLLIMLLCGPLFAVSMNFEGNFRAETALYNRLHLGLAVPNNASKTFISGRALLNPNLVIDDHFSLKSQWTLLATAGTGAIPGGLLQPIGGLSGTPPRRLRLTVGWPRA